MEGFFRYLYADFFKTRRLYIRLLHVLLPVCMAAAFLLYYSFAPWNPYGKVEAYFQILGIAYPLLISLFCVMLAEQEFEAGTFQGMLMAAGRRASFFGKLALLLLFGLFFLWSSGILFGAGYRYLLEQSVVPVSFYWYAPLILWGSGVCLYIWHLFLAFRWSKGLSLGIGVTESLLAALMLTGMGDRIWMYLPFAWQARLVSQFQAVYCRQESFGGDGMLAVTCCILYTLLAFAAFGIWSGRWEGNHSGD